jgi:hypothetical protein
VRPCQTLIPFFEALMHLCRSAPQAMPQGNHRAKVVNRLNQTDFGDTKIGAASSITHGKCHMERERR